VGRLAAGGGGMATGGFFLGDGGGVGPSATGLVKAAAVG
jgi:hypothetical protein